RTTGANGDRFKSRVRDLTRRTRGVSLPKLIEQLAPYLIGWRGYCHGRRGSMVKSPG
ncbi:MAG: group II intron maturase-specific domain-containing protein, partial [Gammaproteobacteria bacterium]